MPRPLHLYADRLFPTEPSVRDLTRQLYLHVARLPIVSPHGHTDPGWFADNAPFAGAPQLLLQPDHYVLRMLYSQGISLERLGIPPGQISDPRTAWRIFADHYYLFRATPSRMWLDWVFAQVFGLKVRLESATADLYFDTINEQLATPPFRPRALFERFNIEVLATTESPTDPLLQHQAIRASGWSGRVITALRPDPVVDPEYAGFHDELRLLGKMTDEDTARYPGYLAALRNRRAFFAGLGATSTDHGHPTAQTADLSDTEAEALFGRVTAPSCSAADAELFRAHMLTVMAGMAIEDGLVMQLHPGSFRNHNTPLFQRYGRDRGADIPCATDYVHGLRALLNRYGNDPRLTFIVFTLDESTYARELAPLAGHYPALKVGPAWWFHDSPEGMRRYRQQITETAGFYNTVGFNDDTRAFLSIPARHDVARRIDCGMLAQWVIEHRLEDWEAAELAVDLAYTLAKKAYRL